MAELSGLQHLYLHFFREFRCRDCGCDVAYQSRPRNLTEKYLLPALRLRTIRCADCFRRYVRPVSVPARPRELPRKGPHSQAPAAPAAGSRVA